MKIHNETSLNDFEFWAGGKARANVLTGEQLNNIEYLLNDLYPDGIDDTTINDLFWFEGDTIAQWLGFTDFEELERYNGEDTAQC